MRFRPGLFAILALALGGCASTESGPAAGNDDPFSTLPRGKAIKVSYIRFNKDPAGRFIPEYRLMLSEGWKLKYGRSAREPFPRLYKYPFTAESIPDAIMQQLLDEMENHGLGELASTTIDAINIEQLRRVQLTASDDVASRWRIINIETDTMKKTVTYLDNDDTLAGGPRAHAFGKVEWEVLKVAVQWTVQITVDSPGIKLK